MDRKELKKIIKEEIVQSVFFSFQQQLNEDTLPGDPNVTPPVSGSQQSPTGSVTGSIEPTGSLQDPKNLVPQQNITNISRIEAVDVVLGTKGRIFTILFVKKTDGTERLMNCRLGVKKYLKGGTLRYDPIALGLLPVYDLQKRDYRMMNFHTLKLIKVGGQTYNVS